MGRILVIDDEPGVLTAVKRRLSRDGHSVETADNTEKALRMIEREPVYDAIVTDMSMDDSNSGLRVLHTAFAKDLFAEVIVMTAYGNVANAVESMRLGAFDYIEKNAPGKDAYEEIAFKVALALERRVRDLRTIQLWEKVGAPKE